MKIHAVTTTHGKPLHLEVTPGQQHEATVAEEMLIHAEGKTLIGDASYDRDRVREGVRKLGMTAVIHSHPCRRRRRPLNRRLYRLRLKSP